MEENRKRIITIIAAFILLSMLSALAAYGFYKNSHPTNTQVQLTSKQTVDPTTKQVIDNGADQTPETYGTNPATPSMIGFAALLDQGILQTDLTAFQGGISNYFVSAGNAYPPSSIVVLSNASCNPPTDDGTVNCTYLLTVNDSIKIQGTFRTDENGHIAFSLTQDNKVLYTTSITE